LQQYSGQYEPSWVKFKYGAWYLDPKSWEKRDATEPLMDPKELKDKEMSEAKKMSKGLVGAFCYTNITHNYCLYCKLYTGSHGKSVRLRNVNKTVAALNLSKKA